MSTYVATIARGQFGLVTKTNLGQQGRIVYRVTIKPHLDERYFTARPDLFPGEEGKWLLDGPATSVSCSSLEDAEARIVDWAEMTYRDRALEPTTTLPVWMD